MKPLQLKLDCFYWTWKWKLDVWWPLHSAMQIILSCVLVLTFTDQRREKERETCVLDIPAQPLQSKVKEKKNCCKQHLQKTEICKNRCTKPCISLMPRFGRSRSHSTPSASVLILMARSQTHTTIYGQMRFQSLGCSITRGQRRPFGSTHLAHRPLLSQEYGAFHAGHYSQEHGASHTGHCSYDYGASHAGHYSCEYGASHTGHYSREYGVTHRPLL